MEPEQFDSPRPTDRPTDRPTASAAPLSSIDYTAGPPPPPSFNVPLDGGTILNTTFRLWRDDFGRLVLISALAYGAFIVAAIALAAAGAVSYAAGALSFDNPGPATFVLAGVGVGALLLTMMLFIASMAATINVGDELLRGEPKSIGVWSGFLGGLSSAARVFVSFIGVYVVGAILMAPTVGFIIQESYGLAALTGFVGFVGFLFIMLRLAVMVPAMVLEQRGIVGAVSRSLELTRGRMGAVFVSCLLFGLVMFGIQLGVGIVGLIPLLGAVVQLAAGLILAPLWPLFQVVLYAALVGPSGRADRA